ncbi:MAG: hypothetical protein KGH72_05050 [Candidatus Micrarchaeota archaeon]|nr:hypothetical protein [Candidatus Micrarchaeota archaeon]
MKGKDRHLALKWTIAGIFVLMALLLFAYNSRPVATNSPVILVPTSTIAPHVGANFTLSVELANMHTNASESNPGK